MTTINIKEWLNKYPTKCAIIKPNPDGNTATLIEQSAARKAGEFLSHKEVWYGEDQAYSFISGANGKASLEKYLADKSQKLKEVAGSTGFLV